jgi:hypothetical protein
MMEGKVGFSASSSGVADYKNLPGGNRLLIEVLSEHEQHLLDLLKEDEHEEVEAE